MKIGDRVYVHGYVDEIRKDTVIIRNEGGYFGTAPDEVMPQPELLTDDDFETIRIHLNAYKEKLCNQRRWKEAEEYQRIIDRFMSFASAQPDLSEYSDKLWRNAYERGKRDAQSEIIRCKDCKWHRGQYHCLNTDTYGYGLDDFCSLAERGDSD